LPYGNDHSSSSSTTEVEFIRRSSR